MWSSFYWKLQMCQRRLADPVSKSANSPSDLDLVGNSPREEACLLGDALEFELEGTRIQSAREEMQTKRVGRVWKR
jgi:hypothetical protein